MKICPNCKKEFDTPIRKKVFCSGKCRLAMHRKLKSTTVEYDGIKGRSFSQMAYDAGLPVQIGDDVIQKQKPTKEPPPGLKGIDLTIWKAQQKEKL